MRTIVKLKPTCFCPDCGEHFQYEKPKGRFIKAILSFFDMKKYYCNYCKKTYYVRLVSEVEMDKKFI